MSGRASLAWHEWLAVATIAAAAFIFNAMTPGFVPLMALVVAVTVSGLSFAVRIRNVAMQQTQPRMRIVYETVAGLVAILALALAYSTVRLFV